MMRKDSDNVARLDALRPRYEKLRDLKIRNEADMERAVRDLELAKENGRTIAGTDDENEIRAQITENYSANTKAVDEFTAVIEAIERELDAVDGVS